MLFHTSNGGTSMDMERMRIAEGLRNCGYPSILTHTPKAVSIKLNKDFLELHELGDSRLHSPPKGNNCRALLSCDRQGIIHPLITLCGFRG